MRQVAILRPEPGASRTLERARALGLDAFAIPLFAVEAVEWHAADTAGYKGLLLTSANAVGFAGPGLATLAHLPAYCVGEATAEAARRARLAIARIGDGGLTELLDALDPALRLLHLAGEDRSESAANIDAVTVYRARALEPVAGFERLAGGIALVHSPRAARRVGELADRSGLDRRSVTIAAISPATAAAAGEGWRQVETAQVPRDGPLLALAAKLCKMDGQS